MNDSPEAGLARVEPPALKIPEALRPFAPTIPENFEIELYTGLKLALRPGQVVFELGTYCGALSALVAREVGAEPGGRVVVFEASPVALRRAEAMAASNRLENVQFVQAFVSDRGGDRQKFFAIDRGAGAALQSADPSIGRSFSEASEIDVPTLALDDWVLQHGVKPDLVKIDIEGAEYQALLGMRRLLEEKGPELVLEIHGDRILAVGGTLPAMYDLLGGLGYHFLDLHTGELQSAAELLSRYPIYGHLFCSRALGQPQARAELVRRAAEARTQQRAYEALKETLRRARALVEGQEIRQAQGLLKDFLQAWPDHPEGNYLLGFCFQRLRDSPPDALKHYERALELGFSEYWVRYHRAQLLISMGRLPAALLDLVRAAALGTGRHAQELLEGLRGRTAPGAEPARRNLAGAARRGWNRFWGKKNL